MALDNSKERARQRAITRTQVRRVTQPTRTESLPVASGSAISGWLPAVVRSVDLEMGTIRFQFFGYSDSPPIAGQFEALGDIQTGYPAPTFTVESFSGNQTPVDAPIAAFPMPVIAKKNRNGDWLLLNQLQPLTSSRFGLYVFGGSSLFGEGFLGEDSGSNQYVLDVWISRAGLTCPVRSKQAGASADEAIFSIGGAVATLVGSQFAWVAIRDTTHNGTGDAWSVRAALLPRRHSHGAMTISDLIYVTGGRAWEACLSRSATMRHSR